MGIERCPAETQPHRFGSTAKDVRSSGFVIRLIAIVSFVRTPLRATTDNLPWPRRSRFGPPLFLQRDPLCCRVCISRLFSSKPNAFGVRPCSERCI